MCIAIPKTGGVSVFVGLFASLESRETQQVPVSVVYFSNRDPSLVALTEFVHSEDVPVAESVWPV